MSKPSPLPTRGEILQQAKLPMSHINLVPPLRCILIASSPCRLELTRHGSLNGSGDVIDLREGGFLKGNGIRHGHISTSDSLHRGVQVVKCLAFHHNAGDLGTNATLGVALLHRDESVCLLYGVDDGVSVEGAKSSVHRDNSHKKEHYDMSI
jgi:hypothetical protein